MHKLHSNKSAVLLAYCRTCLLSCPYEMSASDDSVMQLTLQVYHIRIHPCTAKLL